MRVAIVHDYLTQRGGAERVVLSLLRAFPGAPLHTSLYEPEATFPELADHDIRPMGVNRLAALRADHRRGLPLYAPLFGRLRIDADLVVASSSGWAHGAALGTTGRTLVYCHTPARWLYQRERYLREAPAPVRHALGALAPALGRWDRRAAAAADRYLANSSVVRERIADAYDIDAEVLPAPHTLDPNGPVEVVPGIPAGAFLCVSRLLPYKNVDVLLTAFRRLGDPPLIVVGRGPDHDRLAAMAGPNVQLLGTVSDAQLRFLYRSCRGLLAASHEDYGITPLEAAAFGKPVAALRGGGFLDTVVEGVTGTFIDEPRPEFVVPAVQQLWRTRWDRDAIRAHAERYAEDRFIARIQAIADEVLAEPTSPAQRPLALAAA